MDPLTAIALPAGTVILGALGFITNKIASRRFDRKHPHLVRVKGGVTVSEASPREQAVSGAEPNDDLKVARALRNVEFEGTSFSLPDRLLRELEEQQKELRRQKLAMLEARIQSHARQFAAIRANRMLPPRATSGIRTQQEREPGAVAG